RRGNTFNNELYCKSLRAGGGWTKLTPGADATYRVLGSRGTRMWIYTTRLAARGRVVALDVSSPSPDRWATIVPESQDAIAALDLTGGGNALGVHGNRLVLNYLHDGRPVLRVFTLAGRLEREVRIPPGDFIWGGLSGRQDDQEV